MSNITIVTGLWDIKRSELSEGWARSFEDHYIKKFIDFLDIPYNLIIFGDQELEKIVWDHRSQENTQFIVRSQDWFKNEFYDKIQQIRQSPDWINQAGWLGSSTQASLEMYNPLVMSKMFLLNDARILSKFSSSHMFWLDAGITSTVHKGYFTGDRVLDKITDYVNTFTFLCFPYKADREIHGFSYPDINRFAGRDVEMVARGGFFGGPVELIGEVSGLYYNELNNTLQNGYMGTEESIFSILVYKHPELIGYAKIDGNGLVSKFFEELKNSTLKVYTTLVSKTLIPLNYSNVGLYVITYNSPKQFETLCRSFEKYDEDYLKLPKKFLLNNSLDRSTDEEYAELCEKYGFEEIKKDNLGICGGRQFIAEHFNKQENLDYYLFYEDDMFFYVGDEITCKNGFVRKIGNLYRKSLEIIHKENLDFLKLNFSEFYGDNRLQWSWHNVPSQQRKELFPEKPVKTSNNIHEAPFTKFENIKCNRGVPFATGEIYYCNWPQVVSRVGNQKMFLDVVWNSPYEQTWMSYIFQETRKGNIKPGILLATPTEHNRFEFYPAEERREN